VDTISGAAEFHDRRLGVIKTQNNLKADVLGTLEKSFGTFSGKLREHRKNAFLDTEQIESKINDFVQALKSDIENEYASKLDKHGITPQDDSVLQAIGRLYDGKVGEPFSPEELKKIFEEGEVRYANQIPPGFLDAQKDGDKKYGDLILWKEMIRYASDKKVDVLFVTDDAKEDWWWKTQGETIGPLPELRQEFNKQTDQVFYSYSPLTFIKKISESIDSSIETSLLNEVANTSRLASESHSLKYPSLKNQEKDGIARGRLISQRYTEIRELERKVTEFRTRLKSIDSRVATEGKVRDKIESEFSHNLHAFRNLERTIDELDIESEERQEANEVRETVIYRLDNLLADQKRIQQSITELLETRAVFIGRLAGLEGQLSSEEFRHLVSSPDAEWTTSEINRIARSMADDSNPISRT
jgi:hypothetical protein